ncbi:uncharacterized protein LOC109854821 [Pseudomyrmex gracilis]|uniref:uncharacterized protein LOC109854821 n=1 Tax=Pseudomyrmex gracilis TaxID=219809 RepID=UPI0009952675|nr:uncharacterized protein LOC109854821 [Pseudomyrmex gracilis]
MSLEMYLLVIVVLLHSCALSVSDKQESAYNHTSGALNSSPTPLPQINIRQAINYPYYPFRPPQNKCPLCDSSVYPYCGEKLFHDACCCTDSHDLPYQCKLADCRFLHANSCKEHRLIANCCCSDDYRTVLRILGPA